MPGYQSRMIAQAAQRRMQAPEPQPIQADFDAKIFRVDWRGEMDARQSCLVLALDAAHARTLTELRLAQRLIDLTTIVFDEAIEHPWSADVMRSILLTEDAAESYDRKQAWDRRQRGAA